MKDRTEPCIYYTNAHGTCGKQFKDVTLAKCKNCRKYRPRKSNRKPEPIRLRRERVKQKSERKLWDD